VAALLSDYSFRLKEKTNSPLHPLSALWAKRGLFLVTVGRHTYQVPVIANVFCEAIYSEFVKIASFHILKGVQICKFTIYPLCSPLKKGEIQTNPCASGKNGLTPTSPLTLWAKRGLFLGTSADTLSKFPSLRAFFAKQSVLSLLRLLRFIF
jgi:hypothetical protein